jgi:hypothetical protein
MVAFPLMQHSSFLLMAFCRLTKQPITIDASEVLICTWRKIEMVSAEILKVVFKIRFLFLQLATSQFQLTASSFTNIGLRLMLRTR